MNWYTTNKPEWKSFIQKQYTIESLLMNKQLLLVKDCCERDIQQYFLSHRFSIIEDALKFCLQFPANEDSYDRKYLFPTKSIEMMTNQLFIQKMGWDQELIAKYVGLILQYFETVDPHYGNINLYHAYFQSLLKVLTKTLKFHRNIVIKTLIQQITQKNFIQTLMKHIYKDAICNCIIDLLTFDYFDSNLIINVDFKMGVILKILNNIELCALGQNIEEERIENSLELIRKYVEESIRFLLNADFNDTKVQNFKKIYLHIINKTNLLTTILRKQPNCIKTKILEVLQMNQILLSRIKGLNINDNWCYPYRYQTINYLMELKIGISFPFFVDLLLIIFTDLGQNPPKIDLMIKTNVFPFLLRILSENKTNNIISARIFQLFKVIFMNLQKQIILNIEVNKSKDISLIHFPLFDYFFQHMPFIQNLIKELSHPNQALYTHLVKIYKIFYQYSCNILSIFNHYDVIPICSQKKKIIINLMEFYQKQVCFIYYQQELSKQLGRTFFTDEVQENVKPTEYEVISQVKNVKEFNPLALSMAIVPQVLPQQSTECSSSLQIHEYENTVIQISKDLLDQPLEEGSSVILSVNQSSENVEGKEQQESGEQSFESFMKKSMKEVEKVRNQRRSKSRTPTKIKNSLKKAKNKWTQNQEDENNENRPISCDLKGKQTEKYLSPMKVKNKEEDPLKIALIKLSETKLPKERRERLIDLNRDSRLLSWLKLVRS